MKKSLQKFLIPTTVLMTPVFVFAQANASGLRNLVQQVYSVVNMIIPLLIALGVLAFMWGIVLYLFGKNKDEGKTFMLWGVIALFVMTSVWGLVGLLRDTIFPNTAEDAFRTVRVPNLPGN